MLWLGYLIKAERRNSDVKVRNVELAEMPINLSSEDE